ncbi:unnamed protein product [Angiostrongylus costaricensis]|uniref:Uncharacterized protein n=1 Tax=Angiostrongylus costaricensis TaxID=334426 RepID=A0A0R3PW95_ANGCS|nr:unnamed protein product [Angiostrongylus costaricensis]
MALVRYRRPWSAVGGRPLPCQTPSRSPRDPSLCELPGRKYGQLIWTLSTSRLAGTCEFADHFGVTPCNSPAGGQPPSVPARLHRAQQNTTYAIAVVRVISAHNATD